MNLRPSSVDSAIAHRHRLHADLGGLEGPEPPDRSRSGPHVVVEQITEIVAGYDPFLAHEFAGSYETERCLHVGRAVVIVAASRPACGLLVKVWPGHS